MKIALIGHGRMGRLIEEIALAKGHEICAIIDVDNLEAFESREFREADVAIEFTTPATAVENIMRSFAAGVPVVCGTTGWTDSLPAIEAVCRKGEGTLLFSSNFSIGVNIFRSVNRYLSHIMEAFPQYVPTLHEVHHVHKLDHPSGTAVTLAEELVAADANLDSWKELPAEENPRSGELKVTYERRGEVPGIHSVKWESPDDEITITHSAKSRRGFAEGAVTAAEWLAGRKGFFTISEMLSDLTHTSGVF